MDSALFLPVPKEFPVVPGCAVDVVIDRNGSLLYVSACREMPEEGESAAASRHLERLDRLMALDSITRSDMKLDEPTLLSLWSVLVPVVRKHAVLAKLSPVSDDSIRALNVDLQTAQRNWVTANPGARFVVPTLASALSSKSNSRTGSRSASLSLTEGEASAVTRSLDVGRGDFKAAAVHRPERKAGSRDFDVSGLAGSADSMRSPASATLARRPCTAGGDGGGSGGGSSGGSSASSVRIAASRPGSRSGSTTAAAAGARPATAQRSRSRIVNRLDPEEVLSPR